MTTTQGSQAGAGDGPALATMPAAMAAIPKDMTAEAAAAWARVAEPAARLRRLLTALAVGQAASLITAGPAYALIWLFWPKPVAEWFTAMTALFLLGYMVVMGLTVDKVLEYWSEHDRASVVHIQLIALEASRPLELGSST